MIILFNNAPSSDETVQYKIQQNGE